jgi:hypothetical protein
MAHYAGSEITTYITLIDADSAPILGATFAETGIAPDGTSFTTTMLEIGGGVYRFRYTAAQDGTYYLKEVYAGPPIQTFEETWDIDPRTSAPTAPSSGATTKRLLRRKILRQLGDLIVVTATANGTNVTLIDQAHLIGEPDAYRGRSIYFTGGTSDNLGEERYITGSIKTARNVSFDYPLPEATAIGDEAEICNMKGTGYKFQDVHDAIDSAIDNGADMALVPAYELVSSYFDDSAGTVAIPDAWVGIGGIQWRDADDEEWQLLNMSSRAVGSGWSIDRANRVVDIAGYTARRINSKQVRLYGFTRPGALVNDDDTTPLDAEWLVKEAMSQLVYAAFMKNPSPERERVLMMNEQRAAIARSKATRRTGNMIRL